VLSQNPSTTEFHVSPDSDIYCGSQVYSNSQVNPALSAIVHAIVAEPHYFGAHVSLPESIHGQNGGQRLTSHDLVERPLKRPHLRRDQPFELLCEDHVGTYVIPFCRCRNGAWQASILTNASKPQWLVGECPAKNQR
jgi:hypothetical protein